MHRRVLPTAVPLLVAAMGVLFAVDLACGQGSANTIVFKEEGQASYFEAGEGGNTLTKSGEPVNPQGYTAASRDLPLGTVKSHIRRARIKIVAICGLEPKSEHPMEA